jgi:diadenosine tetraphosphate (Ap4A) HIT family hydrolase
VEEESTGVDRVGPGGEAVSCPFCDVPRDRIVGENEHALAFRDAYPVTDGHTLVVPRRHVESVFDLPDDEQAAVTSLVRRIRTELESDFSPDGFNIGINDGQAAGQTVGHAHVHVIPRRAGDVMDPRGGVRWVIPDRAKYWGEEE